MQVNPLTNAKHVVRRVQVSVGVGVGPIRKDPRNAHNHIQSMRSARVTIDAFVLQASSSARAAGEDAL